MKYHLQLAVAYCALMLTACRGRDTVLVTVEVTRVVEHQVNSTPASAGSIATDTVTPAPSETDTPPPTSTPTATEIPPTRLASTVVAPRGETASVTAVLDGETIEVMLNGSIVTVRYVGVNAPGASQTCGEEAAAANAALVAGATVTLVKDVSERDSLARLLRYVYAGNVFVNAELVAQGFAQAVAYSPDTGQYDYLSSLEATARSAGIGCHPTGVFIRLYRE